MKTNDYNLIENYFRGNISKKDRELFLEKLENDEEFRKEYDLEKQFFESLNPEDWSVIESDRSKELAEYRTLFENEDIGTVKNVIQNVNKEYQKERRSTNRNWILYSSAAILLVLISVASLYLSNKKEKDLYAKYLELESLPSLVSRGDDNEQNLVQAQQLFEGKQYLETIQILEPIMGGLDNGAAIAYMYLGIAYMELDQFVNAERMFDLLITSDFYDATKGYWYKALLYVKMEELDEAREILSEISSKKLYNYSAANKLIKELD